MKNFKVIFFFLVFGIMSLVVSSCGTKAAKATTDQQGKEYTAAYVCPMHCEGSGSDKPGVCPVCKMDYVANKDHEADGHNHEGHNHEGHNH